MPIAYRLPLLAALSVLMGGCGSGPAPAEPGPAPQPERKAPALGVGDRTISSITVTEIASAAAGLKMPRDLAFNPLRPDELWILNFEDDSVVIVHDASSDSRAAERRKDGYALHFMPKPAALAFGQDATSFGALGTFATCGESRNTYDDKQAPNNFMGPALWSSDLSIFAMKNPNGLGSHLDMLHNTPLCMGIAHEADNRYWVFGGLKGSLDRYDFKQDNNVGQDDHSDGESYQYATGQVKYVAGVPSHVFFHASDSTLYVADTGNSRVGKLDTKSGSAGKAIPPKEKMGTAILMEGTSVVDVVAADSGLLERPSGLKIRDEILYVTDNATGRISAFSLGGELLNYLDTGLPPGALGGLAFGPDGKLYFVDMVGNRVLRIARK